MKMMCIVGLLVVLGSCSTHAVKCHGPLRPINEPAGDASTPATGSQPEMNPQFAGGRESDGSADPLRSVPQP